MHLLSSSCFLDHIKFPCYLILMSLLSSFCFKDLNSFAYSMLQALLYCLYDYLTVSYLMFQASSYFNNLLKFAYFMF